MTIHFVDVSHYNGDYHPVGPTFAKATEGLTFIDTTYATNKARTQAGGWLFVAYHYLTTSSATAQAQHAFTVVGPDIPLMVDVEKGSGSLANLLAFVRAYRALGGLVTLAYIPHWYWAGNWGSPSLQPVADVGLALISSQYTTYSDTGPGWDPYGGMTPSIWQYTSTPIDRDAFKGTTAELEDLCNGGSGLGDVPIGGDEPMTPADAQLVVDTLLQPANVGKLWDALYNSAAGDKIPLGDQAAGVTDPALSSAMKFALYNIQRAVNLGTQDPLSLKTALDELAAAVAKIPTEPGTVTTPTTGSGTFTVTFDAGASGG